MIQVRLNMNKTELGKELVGAVREIEKYIHALRCSKNVNVDWYRMRSAEGWKCGVWMM